MTSSCKTPAFGGALWRFVAVGSAALVLFLATLAASQELHAHFHDPAHLGGDEGCAVGLFANGVVLAAATAAVVAPDFAWTHGQPARPEKLFLVAPRYLRQPERGPPLS